MKENIAISEEISSLIVPMKQKMEELVTPNTERQIVIVSDLPGQKQKPA